MPRNRWGLGAIVLVLCACGDPIAPGDFIGQPRMEIEGIISGDQAPLDISRPSFGILWKWFDAEDQKWTLGPITAVPASSFPAHFTAAIYDLPPAGATNSYSSSGGTVGADVGCPVIFDDRDGDGVFFAADQLIAVSWRHLIVYVREQPSADTPGLPIQLVGGLRPGYRLMEGVCHDNGDFDLLQPVAPTTQADIRFIKGTGTLAEQRPDDACIRSF